MSVESRMKSSIARPLVLITIFALPCAPGGQQEKETKVSPRFAAAYSQFVKEFRKLNDDGARRELIRETSQQLNVMLKGRLSGPEADELLKQMKTVRLLHLQPSFVEAIDDHPSPLVRAFALLCFAEYSGVNERRDTCLATLDFLKQQYGRLKYQQTTFAEAADGAKYFFTHLSNGCVAPATVGEDVDGAPFRLSDYRGKVVMLRFWGDWCPACRAMYDYERDVVGRFRNQPFALIGVNSDSRERCKEAQRRSNLMWRTVWDGGDTRGPVSSVFRVEQWPTIIVIDAEGVIRFRSTGLDRQKLSRLLDVLVEEAAQKESAVARR